MLSRIKSFLEKLSLVMVVLGFILFELRLTIIIPEVVVEILFALLNFWLLLGLMKNVKKYVRLKWLKRSSYRQY